MEGTSSSSSARAGRRKACDLCYSKKIRCDGGKPLCSHCKIYESECTYTGQPRKPVPRISAAPRVESLEARVGRMEEMLKELSSAIKPRPDMSERAPEKVPSAGSTGDGSAETFYSDLPQSEDDRSLPPLSDAIPVVEEYFMSTNRAFPLFDQTTFMAMLRNWYAFPNQRDAASWAAINIVLAMGQRRRTTRAYHSPNVAIHVRNAQSVLDELVGRDEDILGAQVLLGLCMVFQESPDPRPASVLIATSVRLVQRLWLYTKRIHNAYSPSEARQRDRVFWIAYILDKDISLRMQQPSLHADASIDLDLPEPDPSDDAGVIYAGQSSARINFFRARVQLAMLQGKVYDWLYSIGAEKLPPGTREQHVNSLENMLDQWQAEVPHEFLAESVPLTAPAGTIRHFAALHWTHAHCLAMIHRAMSHNPQWVQDIQTYSVLALAGPSPDGVMAPPQPPLPSSWAKLTSATRTCMKLMERVPGDDVSVIWSILCAYISGILLLLVNNLVKPEQALPDDQRLVEAAVMALTPMVSQTSNKKLGQVYEACQELAIKARLVGERVRNASLGGRMGKDDPLFHYTGYPGDELSLDYTHSEVMPVLGNMMGSALGGLYCRMDPGALLTDPRVDLGMTSAPGFGALTAVDLDPISMPPEFSSGWGE